MYLCMCSYSAEIGPESTGHIGLHHRGGGAAGSRKQGMAVHCGEFGPNLFWFRRYDLISGS